MDPSGGFTGRIPQLERPLEMGECCRRSDRLRRVGGRQQRRERRVGVICAVEMERQLTGTVGSSQRIGCLLLQRGRNAAVQAGPLRGQQVGVHDLTEQWVAEAIGVVGDDQQSRVDHRSRGGFEFVFGQVDDRGEQRMARVATDRRNCAQHQSCVVVEIGDLRGDQIGQHDGNGFARQVRGDELAGEEGVAATARNHLLDQCAGCDPTEERRHALSDLVRLEPVQLDAMSGGQPGQLGQPTALARVACYLVGAIGPHQDHPLVDQVASQVFEEIPGHRIGPVQVFEPDDHCCLGVQPRDQLEDGDEQPAVW